VQPEAPVSFAAPVVKETPPEAAVSTTITTATEPS
jgi:hypothetical protein